MAAKARPKPAPKPEPAGLLPPDFIAKVKDIMIIGGLFGMISFTAVIGFSRGVLDTDPLPLAGKASVQAVAATVKEIHDSDETVHRALTAQLQGLNDATQAQIAEARTSRLRSLKPLIEQAKVNLSKEPTAANQDILDALESQWKAIQDDLMKAQKP